MGSCPLEANPNKVALSLCAYRQRLSQILLSKFGSHRCAVLCRFSVWEKERGTMVIRVLIVDDHRVVRAGLRTFLERDPELEVVDEASDGTEAIEKARHWLPNVVLMD